jgi:hypothetical protein
VIFSAHTLFLASYQIAAIGCRQVRFVHRPVVTVRRDEDIFRSTPVSSARENLPVAESARASLSRIVGSFADRALGALWPHYWKSLSVHRPGQ